MSLNTCCSCFFSISVGRKKSQSSVYVNQCSVGGRVMTLVCKNNTSSTRERAFAFASFPLSLSLSCAQHIMSVDRLGKRVLLLLLLLFLDQSSKFDLVVCAMLFFFSSMPFTLISSCF
jgi:hypothetical protein